MMLGFSRNDKFLAVAAAEVSKASGLIVTNICVYPRELNDPDSTVNLCMFHALRLLADAIEVPVVFRLPADMMISDQ